MAFQVRNQAQHVDPRQPCLGEARIDDGQRRPAQVREGAPKTGIVVDLMVRASLGVTHGDPPILVWRLGERAVDEEAAITRSRAASTPFI